MSIVSLVKIEEVEQNTKKKQSNAKRALDIK